MKLTHALLASLAAAGTTRAAPHAQPQSLTKRSTLGDGTTVVGFWGQSTQDLSTVCNTGNYDVVILAFITNLKTPTLNLGKDTGAASTAQTKAGFTGLFDGTAVPSGGDSVANQVLGCQNKGIKVMISFGGDSGDSDATFGSAAEAETGATYAWDLFLGGTGQDASRPFGTGVVLDGLDLDNESGTGLYYADFVTKLRGLMDADASKTYYLSADPMCGQYAATSADATSIPDAVYASLDWFNVQFYNNQAQGIGGADFQATAEAWASKIAGLNKDAKLFLGVPGAYEAATGAGPAIQTPDQIKATIATVKGYGLAGLGGAAIWDAGYVLSDNAGFATAVKGALAA